MKKISVLFTLLILLYCIPVIGQYKVKLWIGKIKNPESIGHPDEWMVDSVRADIFDSNNNLVQPLSN